MKAHACVLGGLHPLAQIAAADVLENLSSHLGPPEIGGDFPQSFASPHVTGQRRVMKIVK